MIPYTAPSTADIQKLKEDLGLTGEQMAQLASVAGGNQWRKYTGGAAPREVGLHMLFLIAARLVLNRQQLHAIGQRMLSIGASVNPTDLLFNDGPADREA